MRSHLTWMRLVKSFSDLIIERSAAGAAVLGLASAVAPRYSSGRPYSRSTRQMRIMWLAYQTSRPFRLAAKCSRSRENAAIDGRSRQ
jgi:hypothetical protein